MSFMQRRNSFVCANWPRSPLRSLSCAEEFFRSSFCQISPLEKFPCRPRAARLRDTTEVRGIISCFWVAMAMASLWMPPLSSQLASMSICLPDQKYAGGVLRMNVADRRGGCPLLVVRASAMDAATELSTGAKVEIGYKNEAASRSVDGTYSPEVRKEVETNKMNRICDKLIDVFLVEKTNPEEWHIFLAFSKEWVSIRPHFFSRCKFLVAQAEDPMRRTNLLKLSRRLKELDEDMQQHDRLLALIEKSPANIDAVVARQRKDFTEQFFEHLRIRIQASFDDQKRREEIAAITKKCLTIVQEYDRNAEDFMSLSAAQTKFDDIVKSPSLEIASKKIENLAKKGELDSSLMLLISKAYSASKESTLMKEEAKDTMLHLYNAARGNMSRLVPKEVRILRYLLSINDPQERSAEMKNAFTPGLELEGKDVDELYTTPEALSMTIENLLDAFNTNRKGALLKEARKLIQPSVIGRLRAIKQELQSQYM